jgi:hypothetical protein
MIDKIIKMKNFFYSLFFCFFLIEVSWGSDRSFQNNGCFNQKKEKINHFEEKYQKLLRENTKLKNQLSELLKKERMLNNNSLERKEFNQTLNSVSSINSKINEFYESRQSLSCISATERSFIYNSNEESIMYQPPNFKFDDSLYSLFPPESNEKREELDRENQILKDKNEHYKNEIGLYEKHIRELEEELTELTESTEVYEREIASRDDQLKVLREAMELLLRKNELLKKENISLEKEQKSLFEELKKITGKVFEESSTQTDDPIITIIKKKNLIHKVFAFSIKPAEREPERFSSPAKLLEEEYETEYPSSKSLSSELEGCEFPMKLFQENVLYQERITSPNSSNFPPIDSDPGVNDFKDKISSMTINNKHIDLQIMPEKRPQLEKKMQEESTQTEEEKKFEDSFILSVIKKNKKLFLSLGCILLIGRLFYLKKEKVIYLCRFRS